MTMTRCDKFIRGLMLDAARLPEAASYYRRFFDFCQQWRVNTVLFRLADDGGSALRFTSHPDLITHPHAFTPDQLRELAAYAAERGIELIPEIESFGHSQFITRAPRYAGLSDTSTDGDEKHRCFNGLCPVHPATLPLLSDLYQEVADIFPGRFLHAGCDEVNWGGSSYSRQALEEKKRHEIWAEFLNNIGGIARSCGREMMIWADHVLRDEQGILPLLDKRIILVDWDYETTDADDITRRARQAMDAGFRVVGTPALHWCRWGPRPGARQLDNIDAFAHAYRQLEDDRCLGLIVSNWVPQRFLHDAIWDSLAYAAQRLSDEHWQEREQVFAAFVQRHFGAVWNNDWAAAFHCLYALPHMRRACSPAGIMKRHLPVPWRDKATLGEVLRRGHKVDSPYEMLRRLLLPCQSQVRQNHDDFIALLLTVRYLSHLFWRESVVVRLCRTSPPAVDEPTATALIGDISRRDREMVAALATDWNRGRPKDAWTTYARACGTEYSDQLLATLSAAADYSAALAQSPAKFLAILGEFDPQPAS